MKVQQACPLFLACGRAERQYAPETLVKLKDCFRSWILPSLGEKHLEELSRSDVILFRCQLIDAGLGTHRQYSVLMAVKLFLKFCREVLRGNCLDPATEVRLPKRAKPQVHFLTNDEVERLLGTMKTSTFTGLRMRVLVEVLLGTGLRISEALSLDRAPFERGETQVRILGKGAKPRTVFFPPSALDWIERFLARRADNFPALFVTTGIPRRWARNDLSKYFKELRARGHISKPLTPHILRHTYCTNLLRNGADITFIKELAGHQDIQTTARYYLGIDERTLKSVVEKCLNYKSASRLGDEEVSSQNGIETAYAPIVRRL